MGDALATWLEAHDDDLVALRRQLHARPELGREEFATTELLRSRFEARGLTPYVLSGRAGLWCDIGRMSPDVPVVALRADLDALPLNDEKAVSYRSAVPGACHACGHDVHTTAVLGAGLALAAHDRESPLPGRVRLIFQHAEELMPGGALDVIDEGGLEGVVRILSLHCDPSLDVGQVGLRVGSITAASDKVEVRLSGPGGHTSRPQNTVDLVYALAHVIADSPGALSRIVDPRASLSLVWGAVAAGTAANAIPEQGYARGTVRVLDKTAWDAAPVYVERVVRGIVQTYGAELDFDYRRGVPPVVNDAASVEVLADAAEAVLGPGAVVPTVQSLGGEDFAWYLEKVPGAMARLGTRTPGKSSYDLHQGRFDVDERCIAVASHVLARAALDALTAR